MISSWVTDAAPCRCTVPRQSAPVSPPPMITTCAPRALMAGPVPFPTARLAAGRNSIAWWMPSRSAPGTGRPRGTVAPPASTTASCWARNCAAVTSRPTLIPQLNLVPSARIWSSRRSRCRFSSLNSGMPNRSSPPGASVRSYTVTACPARVSCCAAASPAGPEPTTATVRPVSTAGGSGAAEHAGALARRRAQPPGELGEVVGGVQPPGRLGPVLAPDQVVPLRDEVTQRAALVAERDAAVHAPPGLEFQPPGAEVGVDLAPVGDAHAHRAPGRGGPRRGQEALGIGHDVPLTRARRP